MIATIYCKGKRIVIGDIKDGVFHKKVKRSKHLFKKLQAWGIDGNYFKNSMLPMNYKIHIYDEEEDKHYLTDCKTMQEKGQWRHYKPHRAQIFLPLTE